MLSLLAWIYGRIVDIRNALSDRGVFPSHSLGARTVSVGNITTGGTGKTPLVAYVANILAERGEKVCILTRGYGRRNPNTRVLVSDGSRVLADALQAGDEPVELARKLLGKAIVIADADRVGAARFATKQFGITAFVLDDAFQHRKAKRDLDIVCIDATNPFGGKKMLPAGRLREPLHSLRRADVVVVTRANLAKNSETENLRSEISDLNPHCSIFLADNKIARLVDIKAFHVKTQSEAAILETHDEPDLSELILKPALAFCGIGNPDSFFEQLRQEKFDLRGSEAFADHHVYTQQCLDRIERSATEQGNEILLTTAKDSVKVEELDFELPCFVVETDLIVEKAEDFAAML